ncbi:hypothetical protein SCUCBS95973_002280 [Sporothrix curviconia]|uniref:Class II aldolase/adducin N-terminal domain-containing protein n=1 Tax=Sporothrix curviconia TaxID=1260050 RepID=A0ABP0B6E1_9PEZI
MASPLSLDDVDNALLRTYVLGCHIMNHHHVVDAYGHLSVRLSPSVFLMCRYMAPALVARRDDLVLYYVDTGEAVHPETAPRGFSERYIHSEVYKAYPGVQAVIHSHSLDVVPFSLVSSSSYSSSSSTATPLRACIHIAGFLGTAVPVWDATAAYYDAHPDVDRSMLVNNTAMGASLAQALGRGKSEAEGLPLNSVALMRGHGYVCTGESIEMVVAKAIYTAQNARVQMDAMRLSAASGVSGLSGDILFFDEREAGDTGRTTIQGAAKPWPLWMAEVTADPLYRIEL